MTCRHRFVVGRWLLLAMVAVGMVLMHHAPAEHEDAHGGTAAMSMGMTNAPASALVAAPEPDDEGMGAMLHDCLAIVGHVTAGALLALLLIAAMALWLWQSLRAVPRAVARAPDRPAGLGGRSLLSSVCVLRCDAQGFRMPIRSH